MKRTLTSALLATTLLGASMVSGASAAPVDQTRSTYLVTFKDGTNARSEAEALRGQGFDVRFVYENLFPGVAVDLPAAAAKGLAKNPNVSLVEPDSIMTVNATQSGATWGLDRSDQRSRPLNGSFVYPDSAGQGVKVYVVDTGIRASHTEFTGRMAPGYSPIADGNGTNDCHGHGTHVAGTVAGTSYGLAKKATIIPVRVLDCAGSGYTSWITAGLDWIAANRGTTPSVANMSLGGGANTTIDNAVSRLHNAGVPVVVAAGNSAANACNYSPARVGAAVTVGATTSTDYRASYSNFGTCLDIFAPGSSITSASYSSDIGTATMSGTSMASPHVAGAAALLLGANPSLTATQVRDQLVATSTLNVVVSAGTGSANRLLYVAPPVVITDVVIATSSLPNGIQNSTYSAPLAASGGDGVNYTWSATGLPSGLTVSGSTISGTPTVSGTFNVVLTVTSGGRTASTTLTLSVASAPIVTTPGTFNKSTPVNTATLVSRRPTFTWTASAGATSYQLCLSTSTSCSSWVNAGSGTSYTWPNNLSPYRTYYWQIRAVNSAGTRLASDATWRFSTGP